MTRTVTVDRDMALPADRERRLMIAISMLQQIALAQDSPCDARKMWDGMYMPNASLEHAIQVLISLIADLE